MERTTDWRGRLQGLSRGRLFDVVAFCYEQSRFAEGENNEVVVVGNLAIAIWHEKYPEVLLDGEAMFHQALDLCASGINGPIQLLR
jgi:hypothetical protein